MLRRGLPTAGVRNDQRQQRTTEPCQTLQVRDEENRRRGRMSRVFGWEPAESLPPPFRLACWLADETTMMPGAACRVQRSGRSSHVDLPIARRSWYSVRGSCSPCTKLI